MKKITVSLIFFCSVMSIMAQHTPEQLVQEFQKIQKINEDKDSEEAFLSIYSIINNHITNCDKTPDNASAIAAKAIWHNQMAELLQNYLSENSYRFRYRTTSETTDWNSPETWTKPVFVQQIISHHLSALENEKVLQNTPIDKYKVLLDTTLGEEHRPTLYDFLTYRFCQFLNDDEMELPQPVVPFDINNADYFANNEQFIAMKLTTPDSLALHYHWLRTMQKLTAFHLNSKSTLPIISLSLYRLKQLYEITSFSEKSPLYESALLSLSDTYKEKAGYEEICAQLGDYYAERAESEFSQADDYITAIMWYERAAHFAPATIAANNAKCEIEKIQKISINVTINSLVSTDRQLIYFNSKNCDSLYVVVVKMSQDDYLNSKYIDFAREKVVYEDIVTIDNQHDYRSNNTLSALPSLPLGTYVVFVSHAPFRNLKVNFEKELVGLKAINSALFQVTDLNSAYRMNENITEVFVTNRRTGAPEENVLIRVYQKKYESYRKTTRSLLQSLSTDENGKVTFNAKSEIILEVSKDKDKLPDLTIYVYDCYREPTLTSLQTGLLLDRSIYRPGQTVHYKGILYRRNSKIESSVVANQSLRLALKDVNGQVIANDTLKSNEFGSYAGDFVIPLQGLSGWYTVTVFPVDTDESIGHINFRVEEYKRPQFEIVMDVPKGTYKLGEEVALSGKVSAMAGYALPNVKYEYYVFCKTHIPWRWYYQPSYNNNQRQILKGTGQTDENGLLTIQFPTETQDNLQAYFPIYIFTVEVKVTDANGETQVATSMVSVSRKSLLFDFRIPDVIVNGETPNHFILRTTNLSQQPLSAKVDYKIESLQMPDRFLVAPSYIFYVPNNAIINKKTAAQFPGLAFNGENQVQNWKTNALITEGTWLTSDTFSFSIPNLQNYQEGYYKLSVSTTDIYGEIIEDCHYFALRNSNSETCPIYEAVHISANKTVAVVGEQIVFSVGSFCENIPIYVEIISNDKIIESQWITLNKNMKFFPITIQENQRGTIVCYAYSCYAGINFSKKINVQVPFINQLIDFEYITFRDWLEPGEKTSFKIKLKNQNRTLNNAELLCSMYDASLDVFASNFFYFSFNNTNPLLYNFVLDHRMRYDYYYSRLSNSINNKYRPRYQSFYSWKYSWRYGMRVIDYVYEPVMCIYEAGPKMEYAGFAEQECDNESPFSTATGSSTINSRTESVKIRTNFAETAFFYPFLRTDENGEVVVEFEIPESLTKWKCQGLAHTKDGKLGNFEKMVQTRKQLMVVPNAPRFLYERDTIIWSAKVVNTGDYPLKGAVTLEFYDAQTDKPITAMTEESAKPFLIAAGATETVNFKVFAPSSVNGITYRMVAKGKQQVDSVGAVALTLSDGEQKSLPVLSKQILLTESLPVYIAQKGEKRYSMAQFREMDVNMQSCVLEFTPNPKWYALLSLPYLMTFPYECNEQVFNRLYSNMLATEVMQRNPQFAALLQNTAIHTPEALSSKLSQNEELKQLLLAETPWVNDALSEEQNIQNLALLCDKKTMNKGMQDAIAHLEKSQNSDGGWAWFAGGRSNDYITQYILLHAGHLREMKIAEKYPFMGHSTLQKAVRYIDQEIQRDYELMKKNNAKYLNNNHLSSYSLNYLYARSYYLKEVTPRTQAYTYYVGQLLNYGAKMESIYMQTMAALTLHRIGTQTNNENSLKMKDLARKIMLNIKNRAILSDEMGMYWEKEGAGYYWYESLIERQSLLIEAFETILQDEESVAKMKIWLLQQKRTQSWGTTRSTADACTALLLNDSKSQTAIAPQVRVALCGDTLAFNEEWESPVKRDMSYCLAKETVQNAEVVLTRNDNQLSYGAVFFQYLQDMDKIAATSTDMPLSVQRTIYKVDINERGEILKEINENQPLKVGDKLRVKLILKSDCDMEFVHLKDQRAAAFEPLNGLSGYRYQDGLGYYQDFKDASVNFFFDALPLGTYVFEYTLLVNQAGTFNSGFSTIQCMYAPEFVAHSASRMIDIDR